MNKPTDLYPLCGADGEIDNTLTPHEIVRRVYVDNVSTTQAWREYLGLTLDEVAARLDISVSKYTEREAQQELPPDERIAIAAALGINPELLEY